MFVDVDPYTIRKVRFWIQFTVIIHMYILNLKYAHRHIFVKSNLNS